ncbi:kelch repeat-containing protein [Paenibacillus sp. yr247]|uniref:kelch repeat-containing protein n=1 Tax=Paenibacillus sp. yr247 TaxID=1761880 RepID=UPI001587A37A|nr:kelch repeat-containing protein [Paenibacillus sp. yr247]
MSRTAAAGDAASSTTVIGDDVYVLATRGKSVANKIYKINLKTNKSDKIVSF